MAKVLIPNLYAQGRCLRKQDACKPRTICAKLVCPLHAWQSGGKRAACGLFQFIWRRTKICETNCEYGL